MTLIRATHPVRALLPIALAFLFAGPLGRARAQSPSPPPAPSTATPTNDASPTRRLFVPARRAGGLDLEAITSFFLVLDESGFGGTVSGRATYHGSGFPYYLRLTLLETGASRRVGLFGHESVAATAGAFVGGGYDGDVFGCGVGVGVARLLPLDVYDYSDAKTRTGSRATVLGTFELRMGSTDGIHLALAMGIVGAEHGPQFGYGDAVLQVPVTERVRLLAHALIATRTLGPELFDLSVKARIRGDGSHRTLFLVGGLGWEALAQASISYEDGGFLERGPEGLAGGPAVRVGVDYRL